MPLYNVNVEDIVAREHTIDGKRAAPERMEPFHYYLPQGIPLPVMHVDIALPVYRLSNWRTRTKQIEYVRRENKPPEYFHNGEEDVGPQRAQHELLIEFAKRGRGETTVPIMSKLRQDKRQTEALLITSTGVVLNGNRRLAAMRELFAENPGTFRFQQIEVMVLPKGLTDRDLKTIEFQLQVQPESKLPYDWAIECLSMKELADSGVSRQEIMNMMHFTRESDVQAMINRFNEAELYLNEYLRTPEDYAAIEHQEQQFIELQRALDRKTDPGEKELARAMCYVITEHSRELESRAYEFKIAFGTKTRDVAERLAARMGITLPEPAPASGGAGAGADDDDLFADDAVAATAARFQPIRELLADRAQSGATAEAIRDICIEIREEDAGEEDAKRPLKQIKAVKRTLSAIDLATAGTDTLGEIQSELAEILDIVESMAEEAKEFENGLPD